MCARPALGRAATHVLQARSLNRTRGFEGRKFSTSADNPLGGDVVRISTLLGPAMRPTGIGEQVCL